MVRGSFVTRSLYFRHLLICTCADKYTRVEVREPNTFQSAEEYQEEVRIQDEEKDMNTTPSLEDDCDPTDLLNHWLEELDMVKMVKMMYESLLAN